MSDSALELKVELGYPGFELAVDERLALDGVIALFGPSGSGKSTLLRAIAGLERPRAGRIAYGATPWFDSAAALDVPAWRRPVGLMFQDARLFAHLDVAGNLAFAESRRSPGDGPDREAVVSALDLGPLLGRAIAGLSGGERQRVALARTLLTRPRLLLLDEPLAALDRDRKAEILPYLERLRSRFALPTIFVSHSVDEVARLAERVLVVEDGRIRAHGPTTAVLGRVEADGVTGRFEAGVVVEGRVLGHDERFCLTEVEIDGGILVLPSDGHLSRGASVRLRIRARDVAVATRRPEASSIRNILPATVAEVLPERAGAFAEVRVDLGTTSIRARLTRASVAELALVPGAPVFALIKSVSFDRGLG